MTAVTVFNTHPPHAKLAPGALDRCIDQTYPLTRNGEVIGDVKITEVNVTDEGVYITYETDVDLGLEIEVSDFCSYDVNPL